MESSAFIKLVVLWPN